MYGQAEKFSKSASLLRIAYEGFAANASLLLVLVVDPLGCEDDFPGRKILYVADHRHLTM